MKTYGSVVLGVDGRWEVTAEPYVMIRLKRCLEGVDAHTFGTVKISDSIENVRDLAWFLERYPMSIAVGLRHWQEQLDRFAERERVVEQVKARTWKARPFDLALPLRRYQAVAAELALRTGRLLVADDVGLGKTATAIGVISDPKARPALVVTLAHLPKQWAAEIHRFAPELEVLVPKLGRPTERQLEALKVGEVPDVIVLSYSRLSGWADMLEPLVQSVVFDEVQDLRTGQETAKWKAAVHVGRSAAVRVGLSATPVYGYGGEIWNVLEPVAPGELGAWPEFLREFCGAAVGYARKPVLKDPGAVGAMLEDRGLMLRRVGADVADEVPELVRPLRIPFLVEADERGLDRLKLASADLARIILSQAPPEDRMRAAGELDWKLRQATGISKAPAVAQFVRMLVEAGEQVVLWGWHLAVYDLWAELLKDLKPVRFTGEESAAEKQRSKEAFVKRESSLLIMSLRSGAGVDGLQDVCRTGVFGELDWSPGVHEQCGGRVWRPGQKDPVRLYFLHSDSGSDPVVLQVLGLKDAQVQGIRDRGRGVLPAPVDAQGHMRALALDVLARVAAGPRPSAGGSRPEFEAAPQNGLVRP